MPDSARSFFRHGPAVPNSPVIVSVPHAGRDYPPALIDLLKLPLDRLLPLEDRHVDAVALAARADETLIVQTRARAWIDLNRAEHERDPLVEEGVAALGPGTGAARVRGGLGLVPRRALPGHDLWRRKLTAAEVTARIIDDHRPFHAALTDALESARRRFGIAILLDLHSMPPIETGDPAYIVLGDRFGRSAGARFVARIENEAVITGTRVALNIPYAGGHILDRHGRPAAGIHAIQVELDRRLYLDGRLDAPGPGLAATAILLRRMIDALADEALSAPTALAAQ